MKTVSIPTLVLVAAFAVPSLAQQQQDPKRAPEKKPEPTKTDLPLNALATAEVGEWQALSFVEHVIAFGDRRVKRRGLLFRIDAASETEVTLALETPPSKAGSPPARPVPVLKVSRQHPSLQDFFPVRGKPTDRNVVDEKKKVGDRELACKKVTFSTRLEAKARPPATEDEVLTERWTIWFSLEAKPAGIVALEKTFHGTGGGHPDADERDEAVLVGMGKGDQVTWGRKLAADDLSDDREPAPPPTVLPFNPFANTTAGEWEALSMRSWLDDPTFRPEVRAIELRVSKVEADQVTLAVSERSKDQKAPGEARFKRTPPSLEEFLEFSPGEISDVRVADETRTECGHAFSCKKITFAVDQLKNLYGARGANGPPQRTRYQGTGALWLSAEAHGKAIVAYTLDLVASGERRVPSHFACELVGQGKGDTVELGQKLEAVAASNPPSDPGPRLPVNALENAIVGDWEALVVTERYVQKTEKRVVTVGLTYSIEDADGAKVLLAADAVPPDSKAPRTAPFVRAESPLVAQVFSLKDPIGDVSVSDEPLTVSGRTFACKKLVFHIHVVIPTKGQTAEDATIDDRWTVWCSSEVKGLGIVAFKKVFRVTGGGLADTDVERTGEIVGIGNRDAIAWGRKTAPTDATDEKVVTVTPLPLNPFANAQVGDFEVVTLSSRSEDPRVTPIPHVLEYRVKSVSDDKVVVSVTDRSPPGTSTQEATFSRKEPPSLESFLSLAPGSIASVKVEDGARSVGGREVPCKHLTFAIDQYQTRTGKAVTGAPLDQTERLQGSGELWLSSEVKGRGVVLSTWEVRFSGKTAVPVRATIEVVGSGNGDKLDWGKSLAEVSFPQK